MRDFLLMVVILGSVPVCLVNPFYGILMWYWVTYFNPHRFAWSYAYDFPVAMAVAIPTLVGTLFAKKSLRSVLVLESLLLLGLWAWYTVTYLHASSLPYFVGHMADATYEINHISKILLMTFIMIVLVTTRERLKYVILVTAGSLGLLAVKGTIFGLRTGGEYRVWGPSESFLADNNAFGLALNMCLPLLFFLARDEQRRWLRILLRVCFVCGILSVLLTYSRGGLLGLAVVLTAITIRSKHKLVGGFLLAVSIFLVLSFAPASWTARMDRFFSGDLDESAEQRLVAWGTAWNFSHDYPVTGGGFDTLPDVRIFQQYQPRSLPLGYLSTGPHSIYFQLIADQGYVGFGLFVFLIGASFWSLARVRRVARKVPSAEWLIPYSHMIEISILGFMISGAFLGFVYLDLIYQMIALVVVVKILLRRECLAASLAETKEDRESSATLSEEVATLA